MRNKQMEEVMDVAMLPLGDGRQIMIPLQALAEVLILSDETELLWRGYKLPMVTLDALCGLPEPAPEDMTTVTVMKAHKDADSPFLAVAFAGTAAHSRVSAEDLMPSTSELEQGFLGAVRLLEQDYLIPDLLALMAA
jgi:hypothetical protein